MPETDHPSVPLNVWALTGPPGTSVRRLLADRILDSFVPPSGVVVDATARGGDIVAGVLAGGRQVVVPPPFRRLQRRSRLPLARAATADALVALPPAIHLRPPRPWPVGRLGVGTLALKALAFVRPGGFLVVGSVSGADEDTDAVTATVDAATEAGLAYFQHVVALLAELRGDESDARRVAHADVLVFRTPE